MAKSATKRTYVQHGFTTALKTINSGDGWMDQVGELGESLQAWKAAIVNDLGGDAEVSSMELSLIELACRTHLLLSSVDRFLLEQSSIVNKSKRQLFPIVLQRQILSDALARYLGQLGLKKKERPPLSLGD